MKVLIVEDEVMAQKSLVGKLTRLFPDIEVEGICSSVKETVQWLEDTSHHPEVVFMDVELSDGNCFDVFRKVKVNSKVVMTTAYDNYAIKAFEAGSVDYLLKPIEPEALRRAVGRCRMSGGVVDIDYLFSKFSPTPESKKVYKERYIVRFNDRIIPVEVSNIAYIYSEEKNNYLVTFDGDRYIIDSSLDVIVEELPSDSFFRISRSVIVSYRVIKSIVKQIGGRLRVVSSIKSEVEMTVSRSRVEDFMAWIER